MVSPTSGAPPPTLSPTSGENLSGDPHVPLIHMVMLAFGGADEHRFHVIDHAATGLSFALVGLLLPGIVSRRPPPWFERLGWALAAWVVLAGQYALYLYWNQAQRES